MRALTGLALAVCLALQAPAQLTIVDDVPGQFIDISATGNDLMIGDEGEADFTTVIGNGVLPAGRIRVGNNGAIGFDPPGDELAPVNTLLPTNAIFGGSQALAPFWDDIGNDIGRASWLEVDNRVIIQWTGRPLNGANVTFQLQIFDNSEATNPIAQFLYNDIEAAGGGNTATIGYQDGGAGFNDINYSFNQTAVDNSTVLTLVIPEPATALLLLAGMALLRRRPT